jgi:hypothetical protein
MTRRIEIAIGVRNVPGLTPLSATTTGVEDFAAWAASQAFDEVLHVCRTSSHRIRRADAFASGWPA